MKIRVCFVILWGILILLFVLSLDSHSSNLDVNIILNIILSFPKFYMGLKKFLKLYIVILMTKTVKMSIYRIYHILK